VRLRSSESRIHRGSDDPGGIGGVSTGQSLDVPSSWPARSPATHRPAVDLTREGILDSSRTVAEGLALEDHASRPSLSGGVMLERLQAVHHPGQSRTLTPNPRGRFRRGQPWSFPAWKGDPLPLVRSRVVPELRGRSFPPARREASRRGG
jgi:hypothetical protein